MNFCASERTALNVRGTREFPASHQVAASSENVRFTPHSEETFLLGRRAGRDFAITYEFSARGACAAIRMSFRSLLSGTYRSFDDVSGTRIEITGERRARWRQSRSTFNAAQTVRRFRERENGLYQTESAIKAIIGVVGWPVSLLRAPTTQAATR